jgi:hypothetical protein
VWGVVGWCYRLAFEKVRDKNYCSLKGNCFMDGRCGVLWDQCSYYSGVLLAGWALRFALERA